MDTFDENKTSTMAKISNLSETVITFFREKFAHISADTMGWLAVIVLHASTLPSLLALMTALSDRSPAIDMVLLVWTGLTLLFIRAVLRKDMLNIVTIGFGFIVQAVMMALIFFK
jgi:hypothetical protein